ncbi:MAG: 4Fe-4S dicluster domain-containing protein [Pseudomonadota bacterium]
MSARDKRRPAFISRLGFQELLDQLRAGGYECLGPVEKDGAIQFQPIDGLQQLPKGVRNDQEPGRYQLQPSGDDRLFSWNHGPQGIKPLCFAPQEVLWSESRSAGGDCQFAHKFPDIEPTAVIGVRACDLAALAIQDQHFLQEGSPDPHYQSRRDNLLLIGVDCAQSAQTCFCASTGDGPALDGGFDIGLSELANGYLIWSGSEKGQDWVEQLPQKPATDDQLAEMLQATTQAAVNQSRHLPDERQLSKLYDRLNHSQWKLVAERCLSCGNCTAVCPTCFCYGTEHQMALDGQSAVMVRQWDSCFSPTHSEMGSFQVRNSTDLRYRQWLTHKLAGWQEQFGRSGCVGCGRCITWCPVGIDLTQEVSVILQEASRDV